MGDMDNMADAYYDLVWGRGTEDDEEQDVRCKYCGKDGLWWGARGDKTVLYEDRPHGSIAVHHCNRGLSKKAILDSFSDID